MDAHCMLVLTAALVSCTAEAAPAPGEKPAVEVARHDAAQTPQRSLPLPMRAYDEASEELVVKCPDDAPYMCRHEHGWSCSEVACPACLDGECLP